MTGLVTEQLDELERRAIALTDAHVAFHRTESGSEAERMAERDWRRAAEDFRHVVTPAAVHRLIAIARAALALVAASETDGSIGWVDRSRFEELLAVVRGTL